MTQYTEDDLRVMFAEHSAREDGRAPVVSEIKRRGARTRQRRWVTAGATLAGAAAAVVAFAGVMVPSLGAPTAGSTAHVLTGAGLPQTVTSPQGPLSLLFGRTYQAVGERVRVTFQPTSVYTGFAIKCADPNVWLLVRSVTTPWSVFGRCGVRGSGLDIQNDEKSVTPDWLRAPQTLEIWVFPADAPIMGSPSCTLADRREGRCDRPWDREAVPKMPERLAAELGPQRGSTWTVGIYDKAGS
ncbi:hypothetical protein [Nonomuraea guangzhouensis]|uniref:Uncharacterized protein n=1 Tax=Nonomuraea guangzhouensis TaxID=1291555 RepID=A0ABW4GYB6_9ACTN|nr:hypothetical protein [Nonomuraea guangzhouensis]